MLGGTRTTEQLVEVDRSGDSPALGDPDAVDTAVDRLGSVLAELGVAVVAPRRRTRRRVLAHAERTAAPLVLPAQLRRFIELVDLHWFPLAPLKRVSTVNRVAHQRAALAAAGRPPVLWPLAVTRTSFLAVELTSPHGPAGTAAVLGSERDDPVGLQAPDLAQLLHAWADAVTVRHCRRAHGRVFLRHVLTADPHARARRRARPHPVYGSEWLAPTDPRSWPPSWSADLDPVDV